MNEAEFTINLTVDEALALRVMLGECPAQASNAPWQQIESMWEKLKDQLGEVYEGTAAMRQREAEMLTRYRGWLRANR